MKNKKALKKILFLSLLLMPKIIYAKDYIICGHERKIPIVFGNLLSFFYVLIRIIVPILLVASGLFTFLKATIANKVDEGLDKAKKKLATNILAALVIFFIASIINLVINFSSQSQTDLNSCLYCMMHTDNCIQEDANIARLCPGLLSEQDKYNEDCSLKEDVGKNPRTDYGTGGGTVEYTRSVSTAGGSAGARILMANPNATSGESFKAGVYSNNIRSYNYYLYTPKQIDSSKAALIVYLHGRGGTGSTVDPLKKDGGGGFFHEIENEGKEYNAYILLIQAPVVEHIPPSVAMNIIKKTIQANNIDEKRVSIWGYSMGAEAMPAIVNAYPNFFSSAVIIAKGYDADVSGFKTVPTYGFYGETDSYANPATDKFVKKIGRLGQEKAYSKKYPNQGHAYMPNKVLEDTDIGNGYSTIMDWVLSQRRTD